MRTCSECHASVKEENFASHLARVHGIRSATAPHGTAVRWRYLAWAIAAAAAVVILVFVFQNRLQPQIPSATAPTGAVAATTGTRVGEMAPEFRVVDINDAKVAPSTLVAGKPGLIFFTATWCLPCIEGLRHLARFQSDVGGSPFRVLVVFVDPRETNDDLRAYRQRFGFPANWYYALDSDEMIIKYGVRFLDTKLVLDPAGIIRFTDVYPANYDTWRRALATVGIAPKAP